MPPGALPSGTVTFLFTDIEGSTKLWESHPEAMRASLARHDALMREAIGSSNGYVFKTIGDAFCAAFSTAPEAVEAVLNAQLSLAAEPWPEETPIRVRMALHTGAVESRDDDYFGPPVNRVARLLSTAHGGQVVVSAATQELVRDALPSGSMLRNLGEHRLKDLGRPETVFQLLHEGLSGDFPPLRSLDNSGLRHNLPQQVTSFVGRERELSEIRSLLDKTRLLTLTGSGGSGKTRLALQSAADLLDGSGDGVWLVELAPLSDSSLVAQTVANALGVKEEPGQAMESTLGRHLKAKRLLLVLDNCEHLLGACASLADSILRGCPQVSILATSREGLGVAGETTYRVPSLTLPESVPGPTPEYLGQFESVRLFVDRAVQVQTSFTVTNENAPAVASICHRLDGIPLAIELAAARVRSLTVEDINSKLDHRFRLLTGGLRTALPRQQTLRSLIDWSYDLLNETERALLNRLSVFSGGWTLEAAESVCSGPPLDSLEVMELMDSLCEKSLVVSESHGPTSRFRLLETVRQYGREKLEESGQAESVRMAHMEYFLTISEEAEPHLQGSEQADWLNRLEREHENLRAAMDFGLSLESEEWPLRLCCALGRYWVTRAYLSEGLECCERSLARANRGEPTPLLARTLNCAGRLAYFRGDFDRVHSYLNECLQIGRAIEDWNCVALSLNGLGLVACGERDYARAQEYLEESLEVARAVNDTAMIAVALNNLGNNAEYSGDYQSARTYLEECLAISREIGYWQNVGAGLYNLGNVERLLGDYDSARVLFQECLAIARKIGYRILIIESLEAFAHLMYKEKPAGSALLWGFGEIQRELLGAPMPPDDQEIQDELIDGARSAFGDDAAFDAAWAEGRAMTVEQAIALVQEPKDA